MENPRQPDLATLLQMHRGTRSRFFDDLDATDSRPEVRPSFSDSRSARFSAEARATQLLIRVLRLGQLHDYLRYGYFTVNAPGWGCFQILSRSVFNVVSMESGLAYCAAPDILVPIPDLMLAQKLLLENDPDRFFQVANQRRQECSRPNGSLL
jgi:hypothetical protein